MHLIRYVPDVRGTTPTSIIWWDRTATSPLGDVNEPGRKLLAAKNAGALKSCPPLLSFTKRRRTGTPTFSRRWSGSKAKLDNRTVMVWTSVVGALVCWALPDSGVPNAATTMIVKAHAAIRNSLPNHRPHGGPDIASPPPIPIDNRRARSGADPARS